MPGKDNFENANIIEIKEKEKQKHLIVYKNKNICGDMVFDKKKKKIVKTVYTIPHKTAYDYRTTTHFLRQKIARPFENFTFIPECY